MTFKSLPDAAELAKQGLFILAVSLAVFFFARWRAVQLAPMAMPEPELMKEPVQTPTQKKPFFVIIKGIRYDVEPLFDYELSGLVTTYHNASSWHDLVHEQWRDYFNTQDVCVIWGRNLVYPQIGKLDFYSGNWTCYVQAREQGVWEGFQTEQLSNNHLLPADQSVARAISELRIGDRIRLKGQLVSYRIDQGPPRRSSTTRSDRGNGACEVVYVTSLELIGRGNQKWYGTVAVAKVGALVGLLVLLFGLLVRPFLPSA